MENQFELDDRMTDEAKNLALNSLKLIKPADIAKLDVNFSRKTRSANAAKVNALIKLDNISIAQHIVKNKQDGHEIIIESYIPNDLRENSPITVFLHGGGWTFGSIDTFFSTMVATSTHSKTVWLFVEYRLCPEVKFPVPLSDCTSALEWVIENKTKFSSSTSKVGICGDSSGGHYAALISNDYSQILDYQILIYPCVHIGFPDYDSLKEFVKDCYYLVPELREFFVKNLLEKHQYDLLETEAFSPILKEDFSKLPKTLLIASELDPLVDHSKHYYKRLQENNIESELRIIKGVQHGFFAHPFLMKNAFNELQEYLTNFLNKY